MILRFQGKEYAIEDGSLSFADFLKGIGVSDRNLIAVKMGEQTLDLSAKVKEGDVEPVYIDSPEGTVILRHTTAHVMAQAVKELFPETKITIGPAIETGFYYDFDYEPGFVEEDLPRIEKRMQEIIDKVSSSYPSDDLQRGSRSISFRSRVSHLKSSSSAA